MHHLRWRSGRLSWMSRRYCWMQQRRMSFLLMMLEHCLIVRNRKSPRFWMASRPRLLLLWRSRKLVTMQLLLPTTRWFTRTSWVRLIWPRPLSIMRRLQSMVIWISTMMSWSSMLKNLIRFLRLLRRLMFIRLAWKTWRLRLSRNIRIPRLLRCLM